MKSFKTFITESVDRADAKRILEGLGYEVKLVKGSKRRIAVVTDERSKALNRVVEIFSDQNATIDKSERALRISSIGMVVLDSGVEILAKPASKNVLRAEQEATESLIKLIEDAVHQSGRPVDITIGKNKIRNVVTAGSDHIRGDPKADIALMDNSGEEVGFISHKKEGGASAFQQYGGISSNSGKNIFNMRIVQEFIDDLEERVKMINGDDSTTAPRGFSAYRPVPPTENGKKLVGYSVFGPEWNGGSSFGRESVHCIGQGAPVLTAESDYSYRLTFAESTHYADDVSWAFSGDYQAIFAATYRRGRKINGKNSAIEDMRGGVYPFNLIKNRNAQQI